MITFFDKDYLRSCVDTFNNNTDSQICLTEKNTGKLFPYIRYGKLHYNSHFETFLLLHNLAVIPHAQIGDLPSLFHDVYTLIDYNYYSVASHMLENLENQISIFLNNDLNTIIKKTDIDLCSQITTSIYHEFGHLYLPQNIKIYKNLTEFAKRELTDIIRFCKKRKYHPIGFISRGRTKMAKEMMDNERILEELACDLWGVWASFCYLKNNYDNNQYIQRILFQSIHAINLKILFDFSTADTKRWIKDWKKNVLFYSGTLNRYNVSASYCIELSDDDMDDKQTLNFYYRSLKNTILYNLKKANNIAHQLISQGASSQLNISQKKILMDRLTAIEIKLVNRLRTLN